MRTRASSNLLLGSKNPCNGNENDPPKSEKVRKKVNSISSNKKINKNDIQNNEIQQMSSEKTSKITVNTSQIPDKKCYVKLKILDSNTLNKLLNGSDLKNINRITDTNSYDKLKDILLTEKNNSLKPVCKKNIIPIYKKLEPIANNKKNDEYDFDTSDNDENFEIKVKSKKINRKNNKNAKPKWNIFNDKQKLRQVNKKIKTAKKKSLSNRDLDHFCNLIIKINETNENRIKTNQMKINSSLKSTNGIVDIHEENENSIMNKLNTFRNDSFNPTSCSSPFRYVISEETFSKNLPHIASTPRKSIRFNNTEDISNIENVNPKVKKTGVLKSILKPTYRSPLKEINLSDDLHVSFEQNIPDFEKSVLNHFTKSNILFGDKPISMASNNNSLRRLILNNSGVTQNYLTNTINNHSFTNISNATINKSVVENNAKNDYITDKTLNKSGNDNNNDSNGKTKSDKIDIKYEILKDFDVLENDQYENIAYKEPAKTKIKENLKQIRNNRPIKNNIKNQPITTPTVFSKNIKQLDIREVINTEDKNEAPVELFKESSLDNDVVIIHNNQKRRSYGVKRKRAVTNLDNEIDEEEKIVKKDLKKKKKDLEFDKLIAELNKPFEEVDAYELIIE